MAENCTRKNGRGGFYIFGFSIGVCYVMLVMYLLLSHQHAHTSYTCRLANPPGIPGLPRDLTSDPGIPGIQGFTRKFRNLLKLVSAGLSCEFVNYEVNNYQCCYKQTSYSS